MAAVGEKQMAIDNVAVRHAVGGAGPSVTLAGATSVGYMARAVGAGPLATPQHAAAEA
jgi:hypothetical protein